MVDCALAWALGVQIWKKQAYLGGSKFQCIYEWQGSAIKYVFKCHDEKILFDTRSAKCVSRRLVTFLSTTTHRILTALHTNSLSQSNMPMIFLCGVQYTYLSRLLHWRQNKHKLYYVSKRVRWVHYNCNITHQIKTTFTFIEHNAK